MRDMQHNQTVRGTAQGNQAPSYPMKDPVVLAEKQHVNPTASTAVFTCNMSEEEEESITRFVAPIARGNVWDVLNSYGEAVVQQAQGRHPFTPIRCHFVAGQLLPYLPPEFTSGIWHIIDQVGARLYGQHF